MQIQDLESLAIIISAVVVSVTVILTYRQVRLAARAYEFQSLNTLQEIIDSFADERAYLFGKLSVDVVATADQFSQTPPRRDRKAKGSCKPLTAEQRQAVSKMNADELEAARIVIGKINDIGFLIEGRYANQDIILGKYHTMIIRCSHLLEAFRQIYEEKSGTAYGHRVLRLRSMAMSYHYSNPKHRESGVIIHLRQEQVQIAEALRVSFVVYMRWTVRRLLKAKC